MFLVHVLGQAALQAMSLALLYRDCRRNSAISNMGVFYGPLACSALYVILALIYWERKGATISRSEARGFGLAGLGVTLFVLATLFIEWHL
jgi:hypothetical protein